MNLYLYNILFFLFFSCLSLFASSRNLIDHHTNITNITANSYGGGNKNWGISTGENGFVYVANNNGLLEYNGLKWRLYTDAPCVIMRSIAVESDNRIYTGGFQEFGRWDRDAAGILHYTSLSDLLEGTDFGDEDIWRIQILSDEVFFQSFSRIYRYSNKNNEIDVVDPHQFIMFLQEVNGSLYIEKGSSLMKIQQGELTKIGDIGASTVRVILPFDQGDLLLGSATGQFFRFSKGKITPWNSEISQKIKGNDLNCAVRLESGHYLFGTLGNGIFETDADGKLLNHYSTANFLQNNSIHAMSEDRQGNVWVAMDEGVAKLEFSPKINYFMDPSHALGAVYAAAVFGENIYLGTNKGLFYFPEKALLSANPFQYMNRVEGSHAQVWSLKVIGNELVCGDNNGAFRVSDGRARYLYKESGVLALAELKQNKQILLSTYHTPALLTQNENGEYVYDTSLNDFAGVCNTADRDNLDFIWMGHLYKGLFQNILDRNTGRLQTVRYFSSEEFSEKGMPVKVSRLGHRTLFIHNDQFFFYNEIEKKIEPFDILNKLELPVKRINRIIPINDHTYWIMGKNSFAVIDYVNGNAEIKDLGFFSDTRYSTIDDYENMAVLNDSVSLICLNNGFALYHHRDLKEKTQAEVIYVDRMMVASSNGKLQTLPLATKSSFRLSAGQNNITFDIASRNTPEGDTYFRYMLEGIDSTWSAPVKTASLSYQRLPGGNYRFRVRPINADPDVYDVPESSISFHILAPWYFRTPAILIWCILFGLFLYGVYFRVRRHHLAELRKQAHKNEEQRVREKNNLLEEMVKHKNNELFQITATMLRKNEMLSDIKTEIESFTAKHPDMAVARKLNRIMRNMNDEAVAKEDWSLFIMHFEQTHENFFKNVKEAYPSFTPAELKLCACLKLNLSTKDIASLLNISARGVEAGRYRLRKKIDIDPSESLNEFFIRNF
ncbi:MAG: triple tyrosine motif-containing protein [Bacteroidales bacterium]